MPHGDLWQLFFVSIGEKENPQRYQSLGEIHINNLYLFFLLVPVSYTNLDVYKRQDQLPGSRDIHCLALYNLLPALYRNLPSQRNAKLLIWGDKIKRCFC